ncbi:MAG: hypothetical protein M3019_03035 [Candidatus Dormibacteraeota bacterium]|nr:hypothetical protein [Candidatus Dormibacteraeota bacterium]
MTSIIYARVTEIRMPPLAGIVPLSDADPLEGAAMLDFISVVSASELSEGGLEILGPVTDATLRAVDDALRIVLGLAP